MYDRLVHALIEGGMLPERELIKSISCVRADSDPIDAGIVPFSARLLRLIASTFA
jgi:hypothetical protein